MSLSEHIKAGHPASLVTRMRRTLLDLGPGVDYQAITWSTAKALHSARATAEQPTPEVTPMNALQTQAVLPFTAPSNALGGPVEPAGSAATMTSREIAELTGKAHTHVLRDIRHLMAELGDPLLVHLREVKDARQYTDHFVLPKRETLILVSGYSIPMRAKIIDRWQELEAAQAPAAPALPNFGNPAEAARAWAAQYEVAQQARTQLEVASEAWCYR